MIVAGKLLKHLFKDSLGTIHIYINPKAYMNMNGLASFGRDDRLAPKRLIRTIHIYVNPKAYMNMNTIHILY